MVHKTQQMHISVQNRRRMDYETKIFNVIPYISTSDTISNITLKWELDLTIFV